MASGGKAGKFVLYGCSGCLAVVAVALLIGAGTVGIVAVTSGEEQLRDETLVAELPGGERTSVDEVLVSYDPQALPPAVGRVVFDLQDAERLLVTAGEPGSMPEVHGVYDSRMFTLTESLETRGELWVYEVSFERTGPFVLGLLRGIGVLDATPPRVEVRLPPDMPIEIQGRIHRGSVGLELGGMWLTELDLDVRQAGGDITFDDPLAAPMQRLSVKNRMGGVDLSDLGNASPLLIEADNAMGSFALDLRGSWRLDSELRIDSAATGGFDVRLPKQAQILGLSEFGDGVDPESALPRLDVAVSGSMENVRFRR
ncbi:hypothetical protein ABI59_08910 [Acidobacteria bacterium Mor1]|nr:hypothetical protein ABI59_08910 [Acidobacteria bacterium Mor1]